MEEAVLGYLICRIAGGLGGKPLERKARLKDGMPPVTVVTTEGMAGFGFHNWSQSSTTLAPEAGEGAGLRLPRELRWLPRRKAAARTQPPGGYSQVIAGAGYFALFAGISFPTSSISALY